MALPIKLDLYCCAVDITPRPTPTPTVTPQPTPEPTPTSEP